MKPIVFVFIVYLTFGQSLDANAQRSFRAQFNKALSLSDKIDNDISKQRVVTEKSLHSEQGADIFDGTREVTMQITRSGVKISDLATFGGSGYEVKNYYFNKKARLAILIIESKHLSRKCFVFDDFEQPVICAGATWLEDEFDFSDYDVHRITFAERQELEEIGKALYEVISKLPQGEKSLREFMGVK